MQCDGSVRIVGDAALRQIGRATAVVILSAEVERSARAKGNLEPTAENPRVRAVVRVLVRYRLELPVWIAQRRRRGKIRVRNRGVRVGPERTIGDHDLWSDRAPGDVVRRLEIETHTTSDPEERRIFPLSCVLHCAEISAEVQVSLVVDAVHPAEIEAPSLS